MGPCAGVGASEKDGLDDDGTESMFVSSEFNDSELCLTKCHLT